MLAKSKLAHLTESRKLALKKTIKVKDDILMIKNIYLLLEDESTEEP